MIRFDPKLQARRVVHRLLRVALRLRSRPYVPGPEADAVTLVLAPHPDDDTLGCAGLILRKLREGRRVHVAYVTDGSASHPDHPTLAPEELARCRREETLTALGTLGVDRREITFLDVADGVLSGLRPLAADALARRIADLLTQTRPSEILLPSGHDGSSEHEAAFGLLQSALTHAGLRPRILEFPVWAWWSPRLLARLLFSRQHIWRVAFAGDATLKQRAIAAHRSQVEATPPWRDPVLPPGFVAFFSLPEEFYFET